MKEREKRNEIERNVKERKRKKREWELQKGKREM
jgi:hypothetical protein